jgi:hypothetical protein
MTTSWLLSEQGKEWLEKEYVRKERSTYDLAYEKQTYAKAISRALHHHGLPVRDKSDAQIAALANGRHPHPTQGHHRPPEVRDRISRALLDRERDRNGREG